MVHLLPFSFIAFFLSGFAGLVYELTWVRLLKHIFGSDSLALSTILTVFIGGIALGAFISGKLIKKYFPFNSSLDPELLSAVRTGQSYALLFIYGLSELVVAIYALFVPFIFSPDFLGTLWSSFSFITIDQPILAAILKFIISAIFLCIPTVLLGSGLPILSELLTINSSSKKTYQDQELLESDEQLIISNLYATNTLGAIAGAVLTGFVLLPNLGLNTSVFLALFFNLSIVALTYGVFYLNRELLVGAKWKEVFNFVFDFARSFNQSSRTMFQQVSSNPDYKKYKFIFSVLLWIGFALGFINLSLEIIWTKILGLIIGSSTYSLTLILVAILLGISLGAYLLNPVIKYIHARNIHYYDFLKFSLFAFTCLLAVSSSLYNLLPWLFLVINSFFEKLSVFMDLWFLQQVLKFSLVSVIAFPVALIEGLIFAFILYLVSSKTILIEDQILDPVGTRVGRASSFNTVGAIMGSFLTGFILIPIFSKFGNASYLSIIFILIISGIACLLPYLLERKEKWQIFAIISFTLLAAFSIPKLDARRISSGVDIYKSSKYNSLNKNDYDKSIDQKILFHKEGLNSTITVEENKVVNAIFLKNNGKIEAGVPIDPSQPSRTDMMTQVLLAKLPVLLNPNIKNAALIGMGSGVTLKALANSYGFSKIKTIDVCEIEELVYKAADRFFVEDYPSEVKIKRHVADARIFLQADKKTNYDLIISQPSDPWISGPLFTSEFWSSSAAKLNPDGLFVQWLQLYSIDPEYLTVALRTFQQVFPETLVFKSGNSAELILVGAKKHLDINTYAIDHRVFANPEFAAIAINDATDLFANLILTPKDLSSLLRSERITKTSFDSRAKSKIIKYISEIKDDATSLKPKLSEDSLKDSGYKKAVDGFKGQTSTDDNMLLEFHTSKNIDNFYKTIESNERLLSRYAGVESMIEFFTDFSKPSFLLDLALAHNKLVRDTEIYKIRNEDSQSYIENTYADSLHGKLALELAKAAHEISKSPKSYLALYEIYKKQDEFELADSLVYDSKYYFSDLISFKKKGHFSKPKLVLFEGLVDAHMDSEELAALALLYNYAKDGDLAQELMDKAFELYEEQKIQDKILLADLNYIQAKIYLQKIIADFDENKSLFVKAYDSINKAISINYSSCDFYNLLADINLLKAEKYPADKASLYEAARLNLLKAVSINPNSAQAHFNLAKVYIDRLPASQIDLMTVLNSPVSRKGDLENLDNAIRSLRNALSLEPLSIKANYEMANLQYKIGNLDLSFKHLKRLRRLCLAEMLCLNELGGSKLESAKGLYKKLDQMIAR